MITPLLILSALLVLMLVLPRAIGVSMPVAFLLVTLICQFFIVDIDIGPVSTRVYLMVVLLSVVVAQTMLYRRSLFRCKEAYSLFIIYLAFVLWAIINRLYNAEPVGRIAYSITSTHLIAVAGFLVTQSVLKHRRDIVLMAGFIAMTALISGFVAIMQWLGISVFWNLALMLHPGEKSEKLLLGTLYGSWGFVPGLALYSIPLSYHLITFGMFIFTWTYYRLQTRGNFAKSVLGLVGIITLLFAIMFTQSRSAMLATLVVFLFIVWYDKHRRKKLAKSAHRGVRWQVLLILMFAILSLAFAQLGGLLNPEVDAGKGRYSLSHIFKMEDPERMALALATVEFSSQYLLLGGRLREFGERLEMTDDPRLPKRSQAPHNMFLNAVLYYGLPGVFLILLLLRAVYLTCRQAIRLTASDSVARWIGLGAVAGLIAYLVNAQFHNDSFVTGGTLPWWLLGVLCALITQARTLKCEVPHGRKRGTVGSGRV